MAAAELLTARGWLPVIAPCLRIERRAAPAVHAAAATLVTSGNAVHAIPGPLRAGPVLAVGNATAERARAAGCTDVRSADGDAVALAALLARSVRAPGPVLLLSGAGQGTQLTAMLRAGGYTVRRRVAYAAKPVGAFPATAEAALSDGRLGAALFLSAETARAFVRLMPRTLHGTLHPVDALAIGEPAATILRPLPWHRVMVSGAPTLEGVLALL